MIGSLIALLRRNGDGVELTLEQIAAHDAIDAGELVDNRLPLVIDAASAGELEAVTDWIRQLPGVAHLDVVFVHFE